RLTIELAKLAVKQHKQVKKFNDFHEVDPATEIDFQNVTVSFFATTHTLPNTLGIVLHTDEGAIVYTGDFKFDQTARDGYRTDLAKLAQVGQAGVLLLLSDSAGAALTAASTREKDIAAYILDVFENHNGRIVVGSVASNIMRVQQIFDAAAASGRKVVLSGGQDLEQIVSTAMNLG